MTSDDVQCTPEERAVLDLIDPDELVELTCTLVNTAGENPGGTEELTAQALEHAASERGLLARRDVVTPGRPNVDVDVPVGGPVANGPGLLFLGHSDVVPAGPGWTRQPYNAEVEGDRLYGRGATDMKGGLAAVLVAMDALPRGCIPRGRDHRRPRTFRAAGGRAQRDRRRRGPPHARQTGPRKARA